MLKEKARLSLKNFLNGPIGKLVLALGAIAAIYEAYCRIKDKREKWKAAQQQWESFIDHHHKYAKKLATEARLVIEDDLSNKKQVLEFIGNSTWKLNEYLEDVEKKRQNIENKRDSFVYIHGDPGKTCWS